LLIYRSAKSAVHRIFTSHIIADLSTESSWKWWVFLFPFTSYFIPRCKRKISYLWHIYISIFYVIFHCF